MKHFGRKKNNQTKMKTTTTKAATFHMFGDVEPVLLVFVIISTGYGCCFAAALCQPQWIYVLCFDDVTESRQMSEVNKSHREMSEVNKSHRISVTTGMRTMDGICSLRQLIFFNKVTCRLVYLVHIVTENDGLDFSSNSLAYFRPYVTV